jgi:hypothetical protein
MDAWAGGGWAEHIHVYRLFARLRNTRGEPACGIVVGQMRGVVEHEVYESLEAPPDTGHTTGYIIEAETPDGRRFFVWTPFRLAEPGEPI